MYLHALFDRHGEPKYMPYPPIRTRLSQSTVRELLSYNHLTGLLTWRTARGRTAKAGDEAGTIRADGRVVLTIKGRPYLAPRIIWLWMEGTFPTEPLTAKDGDYANLRWKNIVPSSTKRSQTKTAIYQRERRRIQRVIEEQYGRHG
jgi:hypothetical protein